MWSALSSLAGDVFSGFLGYSNAEQNRDLQERMSRNKYQYAVADLKAAGLNPALAYGNIGTGGSFGSGLDAPSFNTGKTISERMAQKREERVADSMISVNEANARRIDAETEKIKKETSQVPSLSQSEVNRLRISEEGTYVSGLLNDTANIIHTLYRGTNASADAVAKATKSLIREQLRVDQKHLSDEELDRASEAVSRKIEAQRREERKTIMEGARRYGYPVGGRVTP